MTLDERRSDGFAFETGLAAVERFAEVTPSTFSLPAFTIGIRVGPKNEYAMAPAVMSVIAAGMPL